MPSTDMLKEAERVMLVCNACRYCEGFCAVFPAMELRRSFTNQDLKYLANLCHDCRGCYYACQYAPPHEFALNVPKTFAEIRLKSYQEFAWPRFLSGIFRRNGLAVSMITTFSVIIVLLLVVVFGGRSAVFSAHLGDNAFYKVIPRSAIVLPISALGFFILLSLANGIGNSWSQTGGRLNELLNLRAHLRAISDALMLKYLDGGGYGCNYPDDRFSMIRRYFHHLVFYGFMFCLSSTTIAAFYDHLLDMKAPYPFWSWPVTLGTLGGAALLLGTGGMLYIKTLMDRVPASSHVLGMDVALTVLLFLTSLTGLLLLLLRNTPIMGTLFAVHLGVVVALFVTMPYGKFVHAAYRYAALFRNAMEQSRYRD